MTRQWIRLLLSLLTITSYLGCQSHSEDGKKDSAKEKPAEVKPVPNEANLADVNLSPDAYQRLGITTSPAKKEDVTEFRKLGGEVMIPPGEIATVLAPISGIAQTINDAELPSPGSSVSSGQDLFIFQPLLTPERYIPTPAEKAQIAAARASLISLQMTADADVKQITEQVDLAKITLARAQKLQEDRVGSERDVDDARAQLAIAEAGLKVAKQRQEVLEKLDAEIDSETSQPIVFKAPIDGVLQSFSVTPEQTVSAGSPLFQIVNMKTVWIRVPTYVGLLDEISQSENARVTFMGKASPSSSFVATPVEAPPTADPMSSTADLYYRIDNTDQRFRPGERVNVELSLNFATESLVVPANAVLYDIYGNAWVYKKHGDLKFRRERVSIIRTTEELAVLANGLVEGDEVVVDGAAELFGTEFGTGK